VVVAKFTVEDTERVPDTLRLPDNVPPVSGRYAVELKAFEPRAVVVFVPPFAEGITPVKEKVVVAPATVEVTLPVPIR
jgi:hypothetical protein